jgi:peptidoglycan/LPS O-acetylase OafA/YrhL
MVFKKTSKQLRNPIFDLLRIILTVFVINVHIRIITGVKSNFLEPYTWYTVPLFIILSFFFVSSKPLIMRLKRLFLPLIFWSIIGFIVHPNLINSKNIFLQMITGHVVDTPLYYLVLLIIFTIIYWLINKLSSRIQIFIYSSIVLIVLFLEYSHLNYNFFSPMIEVIKKSYGRFVELIKFVSVGLAFSYLSKKINNKSIFFILSLIFLTLFFIVSYILVPPDFHFSGLKTLMGSVAIFSLIVSLSNFKFNKKTNVFINSFGKYSFGVYLSHYLLLEVILIAFPILKSFIIINQFLFLFCFVIFCYLFCFLFDLLTFKKFSFFV